MTFLPMENVQLPCFNVDPVTGPNYGFNSSNPSQEAITDPTDLPGHQRKKTPDNITYLTKNTKASQIQNPQYLKILRIGQVWTSFRVLTQAGCDTVSSVRAGQR